MPSIHVIKNTAEAKLQSILQEARSPRRLVAAAAQAAIKFLVKHFRELDKNNPNKLGGKRTHFWLQIGRSANIASLSERTATISVSDPRYAYKVKGGRIDAKRCRYLAIPLDAKAYGLRPKVFQNETGIKLHPQGDALCDKRGRAWYALKPYVVQSPFRDALPSLTEMQNAIMERVSAALVRQT